MTISGLDLLRLSLKKNKLSFSILSLKSLIKKEDSSIDRSQKRQEDTSIVKRNLLSLVKARDKRNKNDHLKSLSLHSPLVNLLHCLLLNLILSLHLSLFLNQLISRLQGQLLKKRNLKNNLNFKSLPNQKRNKLRRSQSKSLSKSKEERSPPSKKLCLSRRTIRIIISTSLMNTGLSRSITDTIYSTLMIP